MGNRPLKYNSITMSLLAGFCGCLLAINIFITFPKAGEQRYQINNVANNLSQDDERENIVLTFERQNELRIKLALCWNNCNEVEYTSLNKTHGYEYLDEVDIRVIVLTLNRPESLRKSLLSVSKLALEKGETGALEIWIDKKIGEQTDRETLKMARNFTWVQGITRVHVHNDHAGLYSQWMDTWKPRKSSSEIALFIEDDVDISPYAYKYLRDIFDYYRYEDDIAIVCLQDENAVASSGPRTQLQINVPKSEPFYLYRIPGSWGCAPHPEHWAEFREWYHDIKHNKSFTPLVKEAKLHTGWYRKFIKQHREDSMWTMWYIYYMRHNNLFGLYSNLPKYLNRPNVSLSFNRRESGLHFGKSKTIRTDLKLLNNWSEFLYSFPERLKRYDYNGHEILQ